MNFEKYEDRYVPKVEYPKKPIKPSKGASGADFIAYGKALEEHDVAMVAYREDHKVHNAYLTNLDNQFKQDCFDDLGISDNPKRELLYHKAYELGHHSGYSEIYYYMSELVDLILPLESKIGELRFSSED